MQKRYAVTKCQRKLYNPIIYGKMLQKLILKLFTPTNGVILGVQRNNYIRRTKATMLSYRDTQTSYIEIEIQKYSTATNHELQYQSNQLTNNVAGFPCVSNTLL